MICSASAAPLTTQDELARNAAIQWLNLVDAGRYDEAASQGATEVRSFDQWREYFTTHRELVGRVNKRDFIEMKHRPTFPSAFQVRKYYMLRFMSSFEHDPREMEEEIVLAKIGCCWEIFQYKITDK